MELERPWARWADAGTATAVHVTRELPAPRERVFRAWTDPELFKQWFVPPGTAPLSVELDPRPGGRYRIALRLMSPEPATSHLVGTYLEVVPPERLVFTWAFERPPAVEGMEGLDDLDSRVTVQFRDRGASTEVSITHERLDTGDLRAFHRWGWEGTLDQLAVVLAAR